MLRFPCVQDCRFDAQVLLQLSSINLLHLQRLVPSTRDNGSIKDVNVRDTKLKKLVGLRVRQALIPYLVSSLCWPSAEYTESVKQIE